MDDTSSRIIDLGEATALLTLGFTLLRLQKAEDAVVYSGKPKPVLFIFESLHPNSSTVNVPDTIENYNRRRLNVDAFSFYRSGRELKNKIYEFNEASRLS